MSSIHLAAVEESDRRWPDFEDLESHAVSQGFVDGAKWRVKNPAADAPSAAVEAHPLSQEEVASIVNERRRNGFVLGAAWAAKLPAEKVDE